MKKIRKFTFIFYGEGLGDREKASAERYVKAVCANVRSSVGKIVFLETGEEIVVHAGSEDDRPSGIAVLNGSMRGAAVKSGKIAAKVTELMKGPAESIELRSYLKDLDGLVSRLKGLRNHSSGNAAVRRRTSFSGDPSYG